jgi:hypothetical protein
MDNKINSSEALVAYLDILGYSNLIKNGGYANIYFAAIDSAIFRWNQFLQKHQYNLGDVVRRHVKLQVIGDAFIVVLDQEAIWNEEGDDNGSLKQLILMIFLMLISYLIQDCMRAVKLPFRGVVVKGQYYSHEFEHLPGNMFIFSKGLIDAYRLEKSIADVPRIVIDKSVLDGANTSLLCKPGRPDRELLLDNDGLYYLNIYSSVFTDTALTPILQSVASIVKKNIADNVTKPEILRKYIWFANQHNNFVKETIQSNAAIPSFDDLKKYEREAFIEVPVLC